MILAGKLGAVDVRGNAQEGIQIRAGRVDGAAGIPDRTSRAHIVALNKVAEVVLALPGMRKGVVAKADLQGEAGSHVPVVHRISRRRLVDVVADRRGQSLAVAACQAHQHIHEAVVRQRAEAVVALFVAIEHLVLGIPVVAQPELEGMLTHRVREVQLGLIVLGRIVIRLGGRVFSRSVRIAEAADARPDLAGDGIGRDNRSDGPAGRQEGVRAGGDDDLVAVIVDAGFQQEVRRDGAAQLDGRAVRRRGQDACEGVVAAPAPA